ncbi:MAG: YdjY domain-containing protein [Fuerstiella sp.]
MFRLITVCSTGLACLSLIPVSTQQVNLAAAANQAAGQQAAKPQAADSSAIAPVADDVPDEGSTKSKSKFHSDLLKTLEGATGLNPEQTAYLNLEKKKVFLKTHIACNDCPLEMLVCTAGTKEHEAVLSFEGRAYVVHTALLALGIKPGRPVTFSPEFQSPEGPELSIVVHWQDKDGKVQSVEAKKWMRTSVAHYYSQPLESPPEGIELPFLELRYDPYNKEILWFGQMKLEQKKTLLSKCDDEKFQTTIQEFYEKSQPKPMNASFVFSGSYLSKRSDESPEFYAGEDGYLVCVANFAAATIDIKEESSASNGSQSFESNSDVVPEPGTPVIVEISAKQ